MDDIVLNANEYYYLLKWVVAALAPIIVYVLLREVVRLFSRVDEEMWGE